jgi:hypothetical protein
MFLKTCAKIIPVFFLVGVGIETFMIKTGFYDIVTRKEGERRAEAEAERQARRERIAKRSSMEQGSQPSGSQ